MGLSTFFMSDNLYSKMVAATDSRMLSDLACYQNKVCSSESFRAFDITESGGITFLPKGKEPVFDDQGGWTEKNRQATTVGRGLRQMCMELGLSYSDTELEKAAHALSGEAKALPKEDFKLVKGKEIYKWYCEHVRDVSTNSCMIGKREDIFDIYTKNPELVNLLILTDPKGKLLFGRAIVWLKTNNGVVMDRIYGNEKTQEMFKKYAKEMGWAYKRQQAYGEGDFMYHPYQSYDRREIHVEVDTAINSFPYLDSVMNVYKWGISSKRAELAKATPKIKTSLSKDMFLGVATKTDGGLNERTCECKQCGTMGPVENMARIHDEYYCSAHTVNCAIQGNRILKTEAILLSDGTFAHKSCEGQLALIDGIYYNGKNSSQVVKIKNKWYLTKDCVVNHKTQQYMLKEDSIYCSQFCVWLDKNTYREDLKGYGFVEFEGKWMKQEAVNKILAERAAPTVAEAVASAPVATEEAADAGVVLKKKKPVAKKKLTV